MLKAAGSILIIAATTLWGMKAAERVREQYEQMRLLQSVLYALRGEILYARSYLGEAFAKIGSSSPEPYRKWLTEISGAMDQKKRHAVLEDLGRRDPSAPERLRTSGKRQMPAGRAGKAPWQYRSGISAPLHGSISE